MSREALRHAAAKYGFTLHRNGDPTNVPVELTDLEKEKYGFTRNLWTDNEPLRSDRPSDTLVESGRIVGMSRSASRWFRR